MIYLDNSATTQPLFFAKDYPDLWLNSHSGYAFLEKNVLNAIVSDIKQCLWVKGGEIVIGGGATRLIDALMESVHGRANFIGSCYEHNCIYSHLDFSVYDFNTLEKRLIQHKDEMNIVFWMKTNNITGEIFDTKKIGELCRKYHAFYVMDCTASIGHNGIGKNIEKYCDCIVTSAHKYHGPKGIGCMWLSPRFMDEITVYEDYDSAQNYLYEGTVDVPSACAMRDALKNATENIADEKNYYKMLYDYLCDKLKTNNIKFNVVDFGTNRTKAINAITLYGLSADALSMFLASHGVYVGVGHSACADSDDYRVLCKFGISSQDAAETVRVSFSMENTQDDIDVFVEYVSAYMDMFNG